MLRVVVPAAMAMLLAACSRGSDETRTRPDDEVAQLSDSDAKARARAMKMIERATQCEAGEPRDLAACIEACELGHSNSCGWLGELYERRGDAARALAHYHRACKGGSGLGCEGEARAYRDGRGVEVDPGSAARLFAEARIVYRVHCGQRHAVSCGRLAALYQAGLGGVADTGVAVTYRQQACALGDRAACP